MLTRNFFNKNNLKFLLNQNLNNNNVSNNFLRRIKKFATNTTTSEDIKISDKNKTNISKDKSKIKKSKNKELRAEEYTTHSIYSSTKEQEKSLETLKEIDKIDKKSLSILEWPRIKYLVFPLIYLPLAMHTGVGIFDQLLYSKFTHYTFQNFLKHLILVNFLHTGILTGYKLSGDQTAIDNKNIYFSLGYSLGSFGLIYTLVTVPLNFAVFNVLYSALSFITVQNLNNFEIILPKYKNKARFILILFLLSMWLYVILNLNQYQKKVNDQGKFEEVVKFYELANDKEFKKVMDSFEEYLGEIDIKVEKSK